MGHRDLGIDLGRIRDRRLDRALEAGNAGQKRCVRGLVLDLEQHEAMPIGDAVVVTRLLFDSREHPRPTGHSGPLVQEACTAYGWYSM